MKVYISIDIEGIGGVVNCDDEAKELMLGEANAAIQGAFEGGASEVIVNDSHATQRNLSKIGLDSRVKHITGNRKPLCMMQGIDESFDAAFFIGYHASAGTNGVMSHTYDGYVAGLKLNNMHAGEISINAALAGYFGVPVVLVSGDNCACREALSVLGEVETVAVKEYISSVAANCMHPTKAREKIREAAKSVLERVSTLEPFTLEPPINFEITFTKAALAEKAAFMPGTTVVSPTTVAFEAEDYITAYKGFLTMLVLAESVG